jgi:dTDP-glucose pyrophosphorylase
MSPSLLILAAGMGSRYGSLKQVDRFGPAGETIVEYSIYDALRAGFEKIVLVIRKEFAGDFKEGILKRALRKADISFVFQELDNLPAGYSVPQGRIKPWGTGHAVMMAEQVIDTPFAVINADDFYGAASYRIMADFLTATQPKGIEEYCLVDYQLDNTLSDSGSVSRGVCRVDHEGYLTGIAEHTKIQDVDGKISALAANHSEVVLAGKEPVSMNLIGFKPSVFGYLNKQFAHFLDLNAGRTDGEFYIPFAMNEMILAGQARVKVLHTHEKWFGVTYREDRERVMKSLSTLVANGIYPSDLWL